MAAEFERLACETALRGLDKQEELLKELRSRTGVVYEAEEGPLQERPAIR
jgi:hypothetical protein